jgi:hypothetical protein
MRFLLAARHDRRSLAQFAHLACYVGDTVDQALSESEESLMRFYRYLGARLEESANRAGIERSQLFRLNEIRSRSSPVFTTPLPT